MTLVILVSQTDRWGGERAASWRLRQARSCWPSSSGGKFFVESPVDSDTVDDVVRDACVKL